eukprot:7050048-Pyramimonas_sp.AAC.1
MPFYRRLPRLWLIRTCPTSRARCRPCTMLFSRARSTCRSLRRPPPSREVLDRELRQRGLQLQWFRATTTCSTCSADLQDHPKTRSARLRCWRPSLPGFGPRSSGSSWSTTAREGAPPPTYP